MLSVLDGAVLVISAVEGVQPQTRVLMRALQRLRVPTLLFVNKIDRARRATTSACCADDRRAADAGDRRDGVAPTGSARRAAGFAPSGADDAALPDRLAEVLAEHDEALLAAFVDDEAGVPVRPAARGARGADAARRSCTRSSSARRSPAPASRR